MVGEAIPREGYYKDVRLWTPRYLRLLTWLESWGWSAFCYRRMEGHAYRVMLAFSTFLTCYHGTVHIRNHHMSIDRQLGLKGGRLTTAEKSQLNVR